jgi:uncharacterized membrane protein
MTFLKLSEIFLLLESIPFLIPYVNKAIFQYTGEQWYKAKSTSVFLKKTFWFFACGQVVSILIYLFFGI